MQVWPDDGEVEAFSYKDVAGDALDVRRSYFVYATQDVLQCADFAEVEQCRGGVARDFVAGFQ